LSNIRVAILIVSIICFGCSEQNKTELLIDESFSKIDIARKNLVETAALNLKFLNDKKFHGIEESLIAAKGDASLLADDDQKRFIEQRKVISDSSIRIRKSTSDLNEAMIDLIALNMAVSEVCKVQGFEAKGYMATMLKIRPDREMDIWSKKWMYDDKVNIEEIRGRCEFLRSNPGKKLRRL